MIEYSKVYRNQIRRKGPMVKASVGKFEATGKTKTEAKEALESEISWYLTQPDYPEVRIDPEGACWVLYAGIGGYCYSINRAGRRSGCGSMMNVRDRSNALAAMLTHMADSFPEETWDSFLWGLTSSALEKIRTEIHDRDRMRAEEKV